MAEYATPKYATLYYFEPKTLEKQAVQERHSDFPLSSSKQEIKLPGKRYPTCSRRKETF